MLHILSGSKDSLPNEHLHRISLYIRYMSVVKAYNRQLLSPNSTVFHVER